MSATMYLSKILSHLRFDEAYKQRTNYTTSQKSWNIAWLYIALFSIALISFSTYAFFADDTDWGWHDIIDGRFVWNGIETIPVARFFPLANVDVNLLSLFFTSPYAFYICNAICFIIGVAILFYLVTKIQPNSKVSLALILLCTLNLGYVTIIFSIVHPERLQSVFLMLFLLFSFFIYFRQKYTFIIPGIICFNAVLYLKEPMFLAFGAGLIPLLMAESYVKKQKELFMYAAALMISCVLFISLYFIIVYGIFTPQSVYGNDSPLFERGIFFVRGLIEFSISHTLVTLLLSVLFFYRIFLVATKRSPIYAFWDGLLASAWIYFAFFVARSMFTLSYLMPCYFIGALPVAYFLFEQQYVKKAFVKLSLIISLVLFTIVSLPESIYHYSQVKFFSKSFHDTLAFLEEYSNKNTENISANEREREREKLGSTFILMA